MARSVTTKKGDKGETSLYFGGRVPKDHSIMDALGTIDELCSFLGLAKCIITKKETKVIIESIQKDLFRMCSEIAGKGKNKKLSFGIGKADIKRLERSIRSLEKNWKLRDLCFCLPGGNTASSSLDIARTVARRAEREIVTLKRTKLLSNFEIVAYLNRLSDLLYLLARSFEKEHSKFE